MLEKAINNKNIIFARTATGFDNIPGIDTCDYGVIIRVQYTDSNVYYFRIKRSFEIFLQTLIAV